MKTLQPAVRTLQYTVRLVLETRNSKLFLSEKRNNSSQESKIVITNSTLYPSKQYLNSKIEEILHYSSDRVEIVNHEGEELTKEQLVEQYYENPEDYFELNDSSSPGNHEST